MAITAEYQTRFEAALEKEFPNQDSYSRAQFRQIVDMPEMGQWPTWIDNRSNRVARGLYAIPGKNLNVNPTEEINTPMKVVSISSSFVPVIDPNYVPFGNHRDLESIIKSGIFYPSFITGPTGNGKSTMIEQICAKHHKNLIRVNLNRATDEDQLIGSKTLIDGNIEIVEGPLLIAMRTGSTILLDEIDASDPNNIMCLQSILEGKPYYFKLKNEIIAPAPGFNIIATGNTKGKGSEDGNYIGTTILNEAFLERFAVTFEQEYPSSNVELKIVTKLMEHYGCQNETYAQNLVKWADTIRKTYLDGGVDENITTRRLTHIIRAYSIFKNEEKAIQLCLNRFDTNTKTAFMDLYNKMFESKETPVEDTTPSHVEQEVPF